MHEFAFSRLRRFPDVEAPNLQAWDATDELLVQHALAADVPGDQIAVIGDEYGAITLALADAGYRGIRVHQDLVTGRRALTRNAVELGLSGFASHELDAALLNGARLVLLQLPKALAELEEIADAVARWAAPDAVLVAGGRVKHMTLTQNEVLGRAFETVQAQRAERKSRLIVASGVLPVPERPPYPQHAQYREFGLALAAHGGAFAANRLDIGTRVLLEVLADELRGEEGGLRLAALAQPVSSSALRASAQRPAMERDEGPAGERDEGPAGERDEGPAGERDEGPAGEHDEGPADELRGEEGGLRLAALAQPVSSSALRASAQRPAMERDEGPAGEHDEGPAGEPLRVVERAAGETKRVEREAQRRVETTPTPTVVDLGCGTGALAAYYALHHPDVSITATDRSASAAASARLTMVVNGVEDRVTVTHDDAGSEIPDGSADLILLNPPFHLGASVHKGAATRLFEASARMLKPGGELLTVFNSRLAYRPELTRLIGPTEQLHRTSKFTVTRSIRR